MNILVLGAAGFIGGHLCSALVVAGHTVRAFDRVTPNDRETLSCVEYCCGDVSSQQDITSAVQGMDVVYHLAATTVPATSNLDPAADLHGNVTPVLQLLDILTDLPDPPALIFVSSGGTVYGVPRTIPIPEDHSTDPVCAYGITKLAIEKYLALYHHLHGLEYRIVRLSNPYGPGQNPRGGQGVVSAFIASVLQGKALEIWGDGSVVRDYIYIADLCSILEKIVHYQGNARIFNIGSGVGSSLNDLVDVLRDISPQGIDVRLAPARACDVPVNILDIRRVCRELDWRPGTTLEQGVKQTFKQMCRENEYFS